jgi:hypothetical protein
VFFTTRILIELNKAYKVQLGLTNQIKPDEDKSKAMTSKHRRTTVTLVSIVVAFVLLQLLSVVQIILSVKAPALGDYYFSRDGWQSFYKIINEDFINLSLFTTCVQSALNFFIFCLTGQRYRMILAEAFKCKK